MEKSQNIGYNTGMAIAQNKKAYMEYEILDRFEAGLVLTGREIKAIRAGRINLTGTFCRVQNLPRGKAGNEVYVLNMHISTVDEPERSRKLLLHKSQIKELYGKTQQKGFALVPLALYLKKGKAKLEIGLARGKKLYDHREQLKKKDLNRQAARDLKE